MYSANLSFQIKSENNQLEGDNILHVHPPRQESTDAIDSAYEQDRIRLEDDGKFKSLKHSNNLYGNMQR